MSGDTFHRLPSPFHCLPSGYHRPCHRACHRPSIGAIRAPLYPRAAAAALAADVVNWEQQIAATKAVIADLRARRRRGTRRGYTARPVAVPLGKEIRPFKR
jgi:hypothetical protein